MAKVVVTIAPEAIAEALKIATWWNRNRPAAPVPARRVNFASCMLTPFTSRSVARLERRLDEWLTRREPLEVEAISAPDR